MKKVAVIGANGNVGKTLANHLMQEDLEELRLLSRSIQGEDTDVVSYIQLDVLDDYELLVALESIDTVFLTVGLEYNTKVWEKTWPKLIKNVVDACSKRGAKLIFFDNVYSYGLVKGSMTEQTAMKPVSKKGAVRKFVDEYMLEAIDYGTVHAIIAKSADYYGPHADMSILYPMLIENLLKGKEPQTLLQPEVVHNFTFVPDAARAMITLAQDESALNKVWHLPSSQPMPTKDIMASILQQFPSIADYKNVGKNQLKFFGFFNRSAREIHEMFYQYENNYSFDSSKFTREYDFTPTPFDEGVKAMVESFRGKQEA